MKSKLIRTTLLASATLWLAPGAFAQTANKAAAEALFTEGKRLMDAGNFAEACPKLADSQQADPAIGTQLNLALCYKKAGRTASAWTTFKSAAAAARTGGQTEREALARKEVDVLEPSLQYLILGMPAGPEAPGTRVVLDGSDLPKAVWGLQLAVDPGHHVIEVSAPGYLTWKTSFEPKGRLTPLEAPALTPERTAAPASESGTTHADPLPPALTSSPRPRTWAWVSFGAGALGLGAGIVGLLQASTAEEDLSGLCDADKRCPSTPATQDAIDRDTMWSTVSLGGFIVGGLGLAAGTTLLLLPTSAAPAEGTGRISAYVGLGSAGLKGSF